MVRIQQDALGLTRKRDLEFRGCRISYNNNGSQAENSVLKFNVHGSWHTESWRDIALRYFSCKQYFALVGLRERVLQSITRNVRAVNPLVKEPIDLAVAAKVHFLLHVPVHNRTEILSGRVFLFVAFHKIMHQVDEVLILFLGIPHNLAEHVQNVAALWVDQLPVGLTSL